MPTVYIINKSAHNFRPAEEFGDLIYLSRGLYNPYRVTKIYREFEAILRHSKPDDLLLATGLPIMISIASMIMSHLHDGCVNWLMWEPDGEKYKKRSIKIGGDDGS